jgi:hypothetical protein
MKFIILETILATLAAAQHLNIKTPRPGAVIHRNTQTLMTVQAPVQFPRKFARHHANTNTA